MLSVVVVAIDDPARLARTLASVVPAIPQGVVRDGWILSRDDRREMQRIADTAGCDWRVGPIGENLPAIARDCASDWLLLIEAGLSMEEGWWREAAEFVETMSHLEKSVPRGAAFSYAVSRYGLAPRLKEWLVAAAAYAPFLRLRHRAVIVRRSAIINDRKADFPVNLGFSPVILRAAAIAP